MLRGARSRSSQIGVGCKPLQGNSPGSGACSWVRCGIWPAPGREPSNSPDVSKRKINNLEEMSMRIPVTILALATAMSIAAPAMATERGAVGGAVAGGAVGAAVGGPVGAVVGAGTGAIVGSRISGHRYYH